MLRADKLLFPLDEFYERAGLIAPRVVAIQPDEVPEPHRRLLVHGNDMTPTLEAHHGGPIHLRVIGKRLDGEALTRLVVLLLNGSEQPVEFGAIIIHCDRFPEPARRVIRECRRPLGTILGDYAVEHCSRPQAFIRVLPDPLIRGALGLAETRELFGRRNVLLGAGGEILADVVEILPPLPGDGAQVCASSN